MGGKRNTREELAQLEVMAKEELACREIGQKLGRFLAVIRNLRHKKHLIAPAEDETKTLLQQRGEVDNVVKNLQGQKNVLDYELDYLKTEKERRSNHYGSPELPARNISQKIDEPKTVETRLAHFIWSRANSHAVKSVLEMSSHLVTRLARALG